MPDPTTTPTFYHFRRCGKSVAVTTPDGQFRGFFTWAELFYYGYMGDQACVS